MKNIRKNIKNMEKFYKDKEIIFAPYLLSELTEIIRFKNQKEAEEKVIAVNRDRQIDYILNDIEFVQYTISETEKYKEFVKKNLSTNIF